MDILPYASGALFCTTLLDGGDSPPGIEFESGPTLASGDFKVVTDKVPIANLSAESISFTSGSAEPAVGDTLTGGTSSETMVYIGSYLTSGSWSGGDAAGEMFVEQVSGTFQSEDVNNTTQSSSNVFTIGGDVDSAAFQANGTTCWIALTSTEMTCRLGMIQIADQAATVFQDDALPFRTSGHASSYYPDTASTISDEIAALNNLAASDVQTVVEDNKLDHLVAVADSDDPVDNSIIAKLAASDGDWSGYSAASDSLEAIRDHVGDGTNLTEAGGDGDHLTEAGGDGDHLTEAGGTGDQLTALATAAALTTVDTVVDAVKAKTDQLAFTQANEVDANIQSINDVAIVGDGDGTPFGV